MIAYDELGDQWRAWFHPTVPWTEVLRGGPEVLARHADRTLLLCWPDLWSGFDEASLRACAGDRVAFVGEPGDSGTGSEGFRRLLRRDWRPFDDAPVPQWEGANDHLVVYRRRVPLRRPSAPPARRRGRPCPRAGP